MPDWILDLLKMLGPQLAFIIVFVFCLFRFLTKIIDKFSGIFADKLEESFKTSNQLFSKHVVAQEEMGRQSRNIADVLGKILDIMKEENYRRKHGSGG